MYDYRKQNTRQKTHLISFNINAATTSGHRNKCVTLEDQINDDDKPTRNVCTTSKFTNILQNL